MSVAWSQPVALVFGETSISLQTANQAGTYSERCPPFRSFRHLQSVHHLMCPPRDRWFLNHVIMSSCLIMSHHVIWNTWSQSGANGCAGVLARRMLRGWKKSSLIPDDSNHCWWLVYMSKTDVSGINRISCSRPAVFWRSCLLSFVMHVYSLHSLQIDPDTCYRYRSVSQYVDLWAKVQKYIKSIDKSYTLNDWKWQPTATTSPRRGCGISSTQGPPLRTAEVPFLPTGNATWSGPFRVTQRVISASISLKKMGRSKVGSEFSLGRSLGSLGSLGFLSFLVLSQFFLCRFSGGLDNGKSLSHLRGHGWQPASSEKYPSFCNENLYEKPRLWESKLKYI